MPLGHRPATANLSEIWKPNTGQDPARYLIADGNLRHSRPSFQSGDDIFIFPIGVEGFRRSGQALLGKHYYIGDDEVDVQVIHLDEARIEMSGTFPGTSAVDNMIELTGLIRKKTPEKGKLLFLPGIFERIQYVNVENYDFNHDPDDRTHSISYTITFIRTGIGNLIRDPFGTPPLPNPAVSTDGNKGKATHRRMTITAKRRTLRAVARDAYKNPRLWTRVLKLNQTRIHKLAPKVPKHRLPYHRFPLGTKFFV
jgi:hypothetical protein